MNSPEVLLSIINTMLETAKKMSEHPECSDGQKIIMKGYYDAMVDSVNFSKESEK